MSSNPLKYELIHDVNKVDVPDDDMLNIQLELQNYKLVGNGKAKPSYKEWKNQYLKNAGGMDNLEKVAVYKEVIYKIAKDYVYENSQRDPVIGFTLDYAN